MDDEFDQIDDSTRNCNPGKMIPRPRAEKLAARWRKPPVVDGENHIPATMIDVESLPTTGGDHVA